MTALSGMEALEYRVLHAGPEELPSLAAELARMEAEIRGLQAQVLVRAALIGGAVHDVADPPVVSPAEDLAPLDTKEAALRLGLQESTLRKWRIAGDGPVYLKQGGAVRYAAGDLEKWQSDRRRRHTADRGDGG